MSGHRITYSGAIHLCVTVGGVKPGTARVWISRGIITRHPDGFDPDEILQWLEQTRDIGKAVGAAVAAHNRYTTRRTA